jgi:hypothetical protein
MGNSTQPFTGTISINPYNRTYFKSSGRSIQQNTTPQYEKQQYVISFLNTKSFITAVIGISKNIPEDDVYYALENKVYDELALDMAVEYNIQFVPAKNMIDENDQFYHVFIVDPLTFEETFSSSVDALKYIDLILPLPLLYKTLYTKEIIETSGIQVFIYFQENDASLTLYNDQEFVYTKSLKFSFKEMHERFSELFGEPISYEQFVTFVQEEGLNVNNSEYQKYLIKLFGELFLHINDVLTYAKRAFEIEKIDDIFIGSQFGIINGLDEYAQTYLGLSAHPLDFEYDFTFNGVHADQIHLLMHLYAQLSLDERYECNFTTFHRPPPFVKRQSGKIIMLTAASLVGAMLYPVTFWSLDYVEQMHLSMLNDEFREVHNTKITREATINLKLADQKKYQTLLDDEILRYKKNEATLKKIREIKVNYPMKAKHLAAFTRDFNRYNVMIKAIEYTEENHKKFTFTLIAKNDKQLTDLLKFLTTNRAASYDFRMDSINFLEEDKRYSTELKAVLQ